MKEVNPETGTIGESRSINKLTQKDVEENMIIDPSLQGLIDEWQAKELVPNSKKFQVKTSPFAECELMLIFTVESSVMRGEQKSPIKVRRRFFPFIQHGSDSNSDANAYSLKIVLESLDSRFQQEIDGLVTG